VRRRWAIELGGVLLLAAFALLVTLRRPRAAA
jgi:hypothetical protein